MKKTNNVISYVTIYLLVIMATLLSGCKNEPSEEILINATRKYFQEGTPGWLYTDGFQGKGSQIESVDKIDTVIIMKRGEIYESEGKKKQRNVIRLNGLANIGKYQSHTEKFDFTMDMLYEKNDYGDWIAKGGNKP